MNVTIIRDDILRLLSRANPETEALPKKYKIIANIPYYLTARLLRIVFESKFLPELMVITIQKEVAERIIARPPHTNLLALSVQVFGKPEIIQIIPASCFVPKPKVESATIKISHISADFFKKIIFRKRFFFAWRAQDLLKKEKHFLIRLECLFPNRN